MPTAITLVVFDLGGVLVRIAGSWSEAIDRAGLPARGDPRGASAAFTTAATELGLPFEIGEITSDEFVARVAAACDPHYTHDDVVRIFNAFSCEQIAGVESVFDALDEAGVVTGVLSNTNALHWERLAGLNDGPPEYPAVVRAKHLHASHLFGLRKPDAAIYAAFAQETGHDPAQILFFDDLERNVIGARTAGWTAEHIDAAQPSPPQLLAALRRHRVLQ